MRSVSWGVAIQDRNALPYDPPTKCFAFAEGSPRRCAPRDDAPGLQPRAEGSGGLTCGLSKHEFGERGDGDPNSYA